jgi:hypothetical protein
VSEREADDVAEPEADNARADDQSHNREETDEEPNV